MGFDRGVSCRLCFFVALGVRDGNGEVVAAGEGMCSPAVPNVQGGMSKKR